MLHPISHFFTSSLPPKENYRLNILESTGNTLLFPLGCCINSFQIKHPAGESNILNIIKTIAIAIITMPLSVVGMILKGVGQIILPHPYVSQTDEHIRVTNPKKVQQCYDLALALYKICVKNQFCTQEGLPLIYMCCGTVLGQVRHGGMIPWDDDIDLAIFKENEKQFLNLKKTLHQEGIKIDKEPDGTYKVRFSDKKIKEKYGHNPSYDNTGTIDIFIWSKMSDGSYTYDQAVSRARWPQEFFSKEDIKNGFEAGSFGPHKLPFLILKKPKNYLKRQYGENCLTHGIQTHGHVNFSIGPLNIQIPFFKLGAVYYKLDKWLGKCAAGDGTESGNLLNNSTKG